MEGEFEQTPKISQNRSKVSGTAVGLIALPTLMFLAISLVLKATEVWSLEGFAPVEFVRTWAPEVSYGVGLAVLFSLPALIFRRRVAQGSGMAFNLLMALSVLWACAGHQYFLSTGGSLSWAAIRYWLSNFRAANKVMASEGVGLGVVLSIFLTVLTLMPLVALPVRGIRRRLERWALSWKRAGIAVAIGLAVAIGAALVPGPKGPSMAVGQSVAGSILADMIRDTLLPAQEVEIEDSERLDSSLEFSAGKSGPRPNIVLVMFESLRWKSSDAYFPGLGTTPFLAELAREGALIDFLYTVVPHTTKAVMPINCGIYPYLDTTPKETIPGILPRRCLAHILRSQGYSTAFFQPAGNFENRDKLVKNMGYQVYKGLDDMPHEGFETTNYFGREERMMVGPSLEWLDSVRPKGPFLLTYLTLCTHHNYVSPQSFPYVEYPVQDLDERNYLNAVHYTDDFLQTIFSEFEKRGLLENTVFFIVGDHGEAFGEHGGRQHDLIMWEEGLHAFGLVYGPGYVEKGSRIAGPRSILDIVPTVVDLLGLELKKGEFLGSSLLQPVPAGRKQYYSCWFKRRCLALREGMVKVIYHYGARPMEVYDNAIDPFDEHNLAYTGLYNEAFLREKEREMLRWVAVVNQQYEEWEERLSAGVVSDEEPSVGNKVYALFGDAVELIGYDLEPSVVDAGQDVTVRCVFHALREMEPSTRFFTHVLLGRQFLNEDHVPGHGAWPLEKWEPGRYYVDEHVVHVPGTWPDGVARIAIGFWNRKSGKRLEVSRAEGPVDEERFIVATFKVRGEKRREGVSLEERRARIARWIGTKRPHVETEAGVVFGGKVELVGYALERTDVELAGTVEMTYVFRALAPVPKGWKLTVRLIRDDGVEIVGDHVPIGGLYPPSDWRVGEYVTDRHRIHIDMYRCKPGTYGIWLGFSDRGRPVEPTGTLKKGKELRVNLGTVTIRP